MVTYIFVFKVIRDFSVVVGSLGKIKIRKGVYAYIGSAKVSRKRILRHFKRDKKIHWHIDYLTTRKRVTPMFAYIIEKEEESEIAKYMSKLYDFIPGFGSSDTKDLSHLFILTDKF